jgi:hypothetical protein
MKVIAQTVILLSFIIGPISSIQVKVMDFLNVVTDLINQSKVIESIRSGKYKMTFFREEGESFKKLNKACLQKISIIFLATIGLKFILKERQF